MADVVLQTVPLEFQWPTIDPFLFCVHHDDAYPAGNERLGPDASLAGRQLGNDFEPRDGWRMYHGEVVPGFPAHPHRGFETITYVRRGLIDHSDSLGAAARFGRGDVQWMTAGGGVVHSEMFPLLDPDGPNPVELFQIWMNLPADDKLVEPHFSMLWDHDIPRVTTTDGEGRGVEVTVIAGTLAGASAPPPPPHSWASRPDSDVAIWHVVLEAGASFELPAAASDETVRTLYVFEGDGLDIAGEAVGARTGNVVRATQPVVVTAPASGAEVLVLQGRPIGEPVAQYGPFVMNDRAGIEQAFADYQRTGFGGWPWPADDPNHGPDRGRFARHADGRLEEVG
ncbi:MAG: pirin family protein [Acidimicrobiales bacterium]|nr:pirin family protein [Acidimicrobiales bacterium]